MKVVLPFCKRLVAPTFVALTACATATVAELAGSEWRPTQIGSTSVSSQSKLFVQFKSDRKLTGYGGCNRFFGQYAISGNEIKIGPVGATRMACPKPVMDLEMALFAVLETAKMFRRNENILVLLDARRKEQARLIQTNGD